MWPDENDYVDEADFEKEWYDFDPELEMDGYEEGRMSIEDETEMREQHYYTNDDDRRHREEIEEREDELRELERRQRYDNDFLEMLKLRQDDFFDD